MSSIQKNRYKNFSEEKKIHYRNRQKSYSLLNKCKIKEWHKNNYIQKHEIYKSKRIANRLNKNKKDRERRLNFSEQKKLKVKEQTRSYSLKNKEKINKRRNELRKQQRKEDIVFNLRLRYSNRVRKILKSNGWESTRSKMNFLGCSKAEFKLHFESLFSEGMSWEKFTLGDIVIDHIFPISEAINEQGVILLSHYLNLRPMWKQDNLYKSNKITRESLEALKKVLTIYNISEIIMKTKSYKLGEINICD